MEELVFDDDAKGASNYQDLVSKWSAAGFDVRAIDMGKGFGNSNIAVRMSDGAGTGKDPFEGDDGSGGGGDGGSIPAEVTTLIPAETTRISVEAIPLSIWTTTTHKVKTSSKTTT